MTTGLEVVHGDVSLRQTITDIVVAAGAKGVTVAEAREAMPDRHHGHISGVFSIQHQQGNFARLAEERDGYKVYVHADATYGRPTEHHGRMGGLTKDEIEWACSLIETLEYWFSPDLDNSRYGTQKDRVDQPGCRPLFVAAMRKAWSRRPR